jgi:cbb3-type cytochrome oxidase cytochrome c subunit
VTGARKAAASWRWLARRPFLLGLTGAVLISTQTLYVLLASGRTAAAGTTAGPVSESFGLTPAQASRARGLIVNNSCLVCHRLGEAGGSMGPDLTNYAERELRADDVMVFLKQPRSWYPSARMPAYKALPPEDLALIANYLCGLLDPSRLRRLPPGSDLSRGVCGPRFMPVGGASAGEEASR